MEPRTCTTTDHEWANITDGEGRLVYLICARCAAKIRPPDVVPGTDLVEK